MKLGIQMVLAALLATSLAATLDAQQPDGQNRQRGQGGPGGPGGGRGGFGFGGPGGMFGGGGLMALVQIPEVQKEIKVTDDQKGLIDEMAKDLRDGGARPNREDFQNLTDEQRTARFAEMRKQAEERAKQAEEGLKAALEAPQFARLNELRIQREGAVAALSRAEVAEQLKLSQDQKDKVAKINEANRGGGFGGGGQRPAGGGQPAAGGQQPDREAMMAEFRARREKTEGEALAVLTAEQKTSFEKMKGAKFEFPAPQFGGGRGPGGQPGARPKAE
ncbi:MAG TPA: hypothetical protein VM165_01360 [Planctomycetaceae bacterium]|nr:hypothetical protein [Planctomycetaceae bacterium]